MKKRLSAVCAGLLLTAALAGCAGAGEPRHAAVDKARRDAEDKKVTLKLVQFKIEITDKVKQMAADYSKEHPNVTLEAEVSFDSATLLKTRFASGDEPDVFMVQSFTDIADWSERLADLGREPWMEKVAPSAVPGMTAKGRKFGFPVAFEGYGFVYNKDLFRKAGIEQVPVTLTELKQANEKLKAAGILSYNEAYNIWWVLGQHLFNLPFAYEKDALGMIDKLYKGERKVTDVAAMNGFFDVLDMTVKFGKGEEAVGVTYDSQLFDFATGKTAMMQQGVWTINSIMKINPNLNMGMFAIPLTDNPDDTKLPVGVPGYYVINKNSKHMEESKKFLEWLHQNGQKYLVDSFKLYPAFTDLKPSQELGPLASDLSAYIENNKTLPWIHPLWPSGANREFALPLQKYVGGLYSREQTLKEVQDIWEARAKR
ncbi:ABC transporter substrate-binding protein [Paenibacillus hamazuiensis]|uniref:ABC transporter substrate-binding protein n=1 Tax=Paenibacillus hamazuiensis TaxID=2936508 RepID=UPI00200CABCB|nr:extracellular solute-binding protein [Paenibacillus hamazuiensis]